MRTRWRTVRPQEVPVVQLGVLRPGRVVLGAVLAAAIVSTVSIGGAQAAAPSLKSLLGPHCTSTANTPVAGETTLTDSTWPTLTSVSWAHPSLTAKPKSTVRVTVKLSDNCSGAGDVVLELRNATTHRDWFVGTDYQSSTITTAAIHDTWIADVPLYGTDAGSISVVHVSVLRGFTSLVYLTKANPTVDDVVGMFPEDDQVTPADYHSLTPPHAAKTVVKAGTTLSTDAAPEPAKRGHAITVTATLKKLKTSTYAGAGSQVVTLQYKAPGSSAWHTLKKVRTTSGGFAKATYKPSKKGTYSFRAVFAGSTYVASATSSVDSVKVT